MISYNENEWNVTDKILINTFGASAGFAERYLTTKEEIIEYFNHYFRISHYDYFLNRVTIDYNASNNKYQFHISISPRKIDDVVIIDRTNLTKGKGYGMNNI